jgi:hypothetical protein
VISALFSASWCDAAMPTTLSAVIRVTDLSMSVNAYHATALAPMVNRAMPPNARNSLALMPKGRLAVMLATRGG